MARFYFHLRNDVAVDDEEGQELPTEEAARVRALEYALDMAASSLLEYHKINLRHHIILANASGETIATVAFGDAVAIED